MKQKLMDVWELLGHDECQELCHLARVDPDLANQAWRRIAPDIQARLQEASAREEKT